MSNNKAGDKAAEDAGREPGGEAAARPREPQADIALHPKTAEATTKLAGDIAHEFRRWMEDEIDEIAETLVEKQAEQDRHGAAIDVGALAERLAYQADMLGYPSIVAIAHRLQHLSEQVLKTGQEANATTAEAIGEQIAELRRAIEA